MNKIPTLRTERLVLRPPTRDDWPEFRDLMQSERSKYMGGPFSTVQAWDNFCHGIALWHIFGFGSLSIDLISTKQCIGQIEINSGPRYPEPELGWLLYEGAEANGYAFEAAIAMRNWAFNERKLETLVSYIDPENARSKRLAERLGCRQDNTAPAQDLGDLVFRHV